MKEKEISFEKPVDIYLLIGVELTEKYNWMILVQISGDGKNVDISIKMETGQFKHFPMQQLKCQFMSFLFIIPHTETFLFLCVENDKSSTKSAVWKFYSYFVFR